MRSPLACSRKLVKCLSRPVGRFIVAGGDLNAGAGWRGAAGMEMAMTLPERVEAIERVEKAAYARGRPDPSAVAVNATHPISRS